MSIVVPHKMRLGLDHCHSTGVFRGWLCSKCNAGLGFFGDNLAGLEKAIAYLVRSENDNV